MVLPLDLSIFVNTLMFKCASKPGLSYVLLSLLNFEDEAIRCRRAEVLHAQLICLSLSAFTLSQSRTHIHSLSLVLDEIKGTQDTDLFSCSFSDSLSAPLSLSVFLAVSKAPAIYQHRKCVDSSRISVVVQHLISSYRAV